MLPDLALAEAAALVALVPARKEARRGGPAKAAPRRYLRVSTPQQDVRSQRLAILKYARKHDFRIDDFIEATASGQASEKRRRLDELTSVLGRGDRLVVSELSRLGRSLGQIVTILDALAKAGVAFVALKENIRVEGKRDIQTKVMTTLFALFAEVERDLISERTREGLARARASGRKLGRPKGSLGVSRLDGKEDEIRRFLELDPVTGPFSIMVAFSEPVTGFELEDLVVGNGSASALQGSNASYTATITPAASGAVTVDIAAGAAQDGAGNPSAAAVRFSIVAELMPVPALSPEGEDAPSAPSSP